MDSAKATVAARAAVLLDAASLRKAAASVVRTVVVSGVCTKGARKEPNATGSATCTVAYGPAV